MNHMQAYVDEFTFRLNKGNVHVQIDTQTRLDGRFVKPSSSLSPTVGCRSAPAAGPGRSGPTAV